MGNRFAIATTVWLVGIAFAGVAAIVLFIVALSTGFHNAGALLSYITMTAVPFVATAAPTKLMSGYVSRDSNGAFHAGPMVLGLAAGCLAGVVVQFALGLNAAAAFFLIAVAGPFIGTILGTLVDLALTPVATGAVSAALGLIFTFIAGGGLNP